MYQDSEPELKYQIDKYSVVNIPAYSNKSQHTIIDLKSENEF